MGLILSTSSQPVQLECWISMANLRGMHENHIRILPTVEEMYLFTDTPSNYSPCALHTILNTSVLKPEGSDIL